MISLAAGGAELVLGDGQIRSIPQLDSIAQVVRARRSVWAKRLLVRDLRTTARGVVMASTLRLSIISHVAAIAVGAVPATVSDFLFGQPAIARGLRLGDLREGVSFDACRGDFPTPSKISARQAMSTPISWQ
jgi:hypothetical protein